MLPLKNAALGALVLLALAGCVASSGQKSGSDSSAGGKASAVLFRVSGRDITAEEFVTSPGLRSAMRQFLLTDALRADCAKRGIKIDEAEIEAKLNEQKQAITQQGGSWEDFLKDKMMTEAEAREGIKLQLFFEKLIDNRIQVTEEELKQSWEKEKDTIVNGYIMENHLPDSDRDKITYEQTKEYSKQRIMAMKGPEQQQTMFQDLVNSMNLDLSPTIKDKKKAKIYEDLIVNNEKQKQAELAQDSKEDKEGVSMPEGQAGGGAASGAASESGGTDTGTNPPSGGGN